MIEEILKSSISKDIILKLTNDDLGQKTIVNTPVVGLNGFLSQRTSLHLEYPLSFQWLYYVAGYINQIPFEHLNYDILSGPFSGCWMVVYEIHGIKYVGHIGTEVEGSNATLQVKKYWNAFLRANKEAPIAGFQPYLRTSINLSKYYLDHPRDNAVWKDCTLGLITKEKKCFSIFAWKNRQTRDVDIVGVERGENIKHKDELCNIFPPF